MIHYIFEKARSHKYIRRLGAPKHYIYTYAEPSGANNFDDPNFMPKTEEELRAYAKYHWDKSILVRAHYPKFEDYVASLKPYVTFVKEEPGVYTAEKKPKEMSAEERLKWAHRKVHHDVGVTVGGAKKEKYAEVNANNLSQLEAEGMKEAYSWVTKDSVFPKMNWDTEKGMGVSAGAAFFKKQLIGAINQRPPDSPQMREAFVHSQRFLSDSLVHCKTVADVQDFIMEFAQLSKKKKLDKVIPDEEFRPLMVTGSGEANYHSVDTAIKKLYGEDPTRGPGYHPRGIVAEQSADRKNWKIYVPSDDPTAYADYLKSFGEKFEKKIVMDYLSGLGWGHSRGRVSTFWSKDKRIAQEYEKADNWSWTGKKVAGEKKERKVRFEWDKAVEKEVQRTGGQDIPENTTADNIMKNFNLRAVEYGNWIHDTDAKYHINQAWGALSDLADILGIEPKDTSLNGRLALAIGARGSGKARAHYEPLKKIVNLTKFSGGGCLAHEWGHAFDNVIAEASLISPSGKRWNFSEGVKSSDVKPETQNVMNAFNMVMDVMTKGDPVAIREHLSKENNRIHELRMKYYAEKEPVAKEKIRTEINESVKNYRRVSKQRLSNYAQTAHILGTYWEKPCELFARAFESYVEDKLDDNNRKSTYLVSGTKSPYNIKIEGLEGLWEPYPKGEERKKINLAMDALMERIRNTSSLKKALNEMFYVVLEKCEKGKIELTEKDERPDSDYDPKQLAMGVKEEMEHTSSKAVAKRITKDHLDEHSDYYTKLKKIEKAKDFDGGSYYVDFDKTLAYHETEWGADKIGHPLPEMVARVKKWLKEGKNVKIFTARVKHKGQKKKVQDWLEEQGLPRLEVTNVKGTDVIEIWDDRAKEVKPNTGKVKKAFSSKNIGIIGTHHTLDARSTQAALEVHHELMNQYKAEGMSEDAASKKALDTLHTDEGIKKMKARMNEIKDKQLHWRRVRRGKVEEVHRKKL